MRPNITISIPVPYLTLDEYCRCTGTTNSVARKMVEDGRLPIKAKEIKPGKTKSTAAVEINMVDLYLRAISESNYASVVLNPVPNS
ncbi:regulator [Pectobacterium versatile]|uniref:regulator n=1 Tax=Pectobacterium versatile TaxID=2488639 RepID=UPI0020BF5BB0|nr:regulator [Pectobacterium versatile]